jgi:hypothetical protein
MATTSFISIIQAGATTRTIPQPLTGQRLLEEGGLDSTPAGQVLNFDIVSESSSAS